MYVLFYGKYLIDLIKVNIGQGRLNIIQGLNLPNLIFHEQF